MKEREISNREKLKQNKPIVYNKIIKYDMPRIQFQASYVCNFKCKHCSIDKVKDSTRNSLTIDEIKDLFDQADSIGISRVTLTGGEPLILPNLKEIIDAIGPKRFWIQMDTNGYLLTLDKVIELKEWGVDCIPPSLDSLNFKEHDAFRNKEGSAKRVLKAFDYIQEVGLNTFVQTVVTKSRLYSDEFIGFIRYFNNRDIGVFVSFAKPVGAYEGHFDEMINKEDLKYFEILENKYIVFSHLTPAYGVNKERMCVASRNIFGITEYGDVIPCIYCYISMGSIREEPLKNILDRCQSLKPFKKNTCVLADRSDNFVEKYLVPKVYGNKLPVPHTEVFTEEDFD